MRIFVVGFFNISLWSYLKLNNDHFNTGVFNTFEYLGLLFGILLKAWSLINHTYCPFLNFIIRHKWIQSFLAETFVRLFDTWQARDDRFSCVFLFVCLLTFCVATQKLMYLRKSFKKKKKEEEASHFTKARVYPSLASEFNDKTNITWGQEFELVMH